MTIYGHGVTCGKNVNFAYGMVKKSVLVEVFFKEFYLYKILFTFVHSFLRRVFNPTKTLIEGRNQIVGLASPLP